MRSPLLDANGRQQRGWRDAVPLGSYLSEITCLPPDSPFGYSNVSSSKAVSKCFSVFAVSYLILLHRIIF